MLNIIAQVGGIGGVMAFLLLWFGSRAIGSLVSAYQEQNTRLIRVVEQNSAVLAETAGANRSLERAVSGLEHRIEELKAEKRSPKAYDDLMVGLAMLLDQRRQGGDPREPKLSER